MITDDLNREQQFKAHRYGTVTMMVLDRRLPDLITDIVRSDSGGGAYQLARLQPAWTRGLRKVALTQHENE